jgi:hypothetical protein
MLASSRALRCRSTACLIVSALLIVLPTSQQFLWAGGAPKKKDHYEVYLKELRQRFQAWDLNNDNVLDKVELAKAFRGNKAKPYDYIAPTPVAPSKVRAEEFPVKPRKGKVRTFTLALVCLPRPSLPVNLTIAELLTKPEKEIPRAKEPVPIKEKDKK